MTYIALVIAILALVISWCEGDYLRGRVRKLQEQLNSFEDCDHEEAMQYLWKHNEELLKQFDLLCRFLGVEYYHEKAEAEGFKHKTQNNPITITPLAEFLQVKVDAKAYAAGEKPDEIKKFTGSKIK